jgi:hypothetical protein
VGVSKQDWKDYQSNVWLAGSRKLTWDGLVQAFDGTLGSIDNGDAPAFLAYTESGGKLKAAADDASNAAIDAEKDLKGLRLEGNQRRFANKNAIATSDAAISAIEEYSLALDVLSRDLVRGVLIEHDAVADDPAAMAAMKDKLVPRLGDALSTVRACNDSTTTKVAALAAIDKIGIV